MKLPHFIRAAPFEFSLYGFAAFVIIALVAGLYAHNYAYKSGIAAVPELAGVVVALAYLLGMPLAFVGCAFALLMLLFRRIVWRKRRAFCVYEFTLHLITALPLMATIWYLFYTMTMVA